MAISPIECDTPTKSSACSANLYYPHFTFGGRRWIVILWKYCIFDRPWSSLPFGNSSPRRVVVSLIPHRALVGPRPILVWPESRNIQMSCWHVYTMPLVLTTDNCCYYSLDSPPPPIAATVTAIYACWFARFCNPPFFNLSKNCGRSSFPYHQYMFFFTWQIILVLSKILTTS